MTTEALLDSGMEGKMREELVDVDAGIAGEQTVGLGRITVLEALAEPAVFISPNASNRSTPPVDTDFDDQ